MFSRIILFTLLNFVYVGYAQMLDAVRIEVPSNIDVDQFHVETMGDKGMLIFY